MKTRILVVVLCLACVASYAQRRRRRAVKKPVQTTQQQVKKDTTAAAGMTMSAVPGQTVDTTQKGPAKPFERPLDGYYNKTNILSAKVTPFAYIRESDAIYVKRIWREIDLREKMNQYLASPKARLIDVLVNAIKAGELTAYDPTPNPAKDDPDGDAFSTPLTPAQAMAKLAEPVVVDKFDSTGNKIGSVVQPGELNPDSIVKFRIKEDWIFDKQRSVFEPRIIGIAPMVRPKAGSIQLDYQPAFWIYFPDARPILAVKEVALEHNDNTGLSFDDVFVKRLFASYIVKESNDKDERIKDYETGIDKLYEADRIKKKLLDWELNLWQY